MRKKKKKAPLETAVKQERTKERKTERKEIHGDDDHVDGGPALSIVPVPQLSTTVASREYRFGRRPDTFGHTNSDMKLPRERERERDGVGRWATVKTAQ